MRDIVTFCKETTNKIEDDIKSKETSIKTKTNETKFNEIDVALKENRQKRIKYLQQGKNKKFYRLKYHSNQPTLRTGRADKEQSQQYRQQHKSRSRSRSRNNPKLSYAEKVKQQQSQAKQANKKQHQSSRKNNQDRDKQIEMLQKQINELRNERNESSNLNPPKNLQVAPNTGAKIQTPEKMTNAEIFILIRNTMKTLNTYATQSEQQENLLQIQ